jgi:hypothetical protein
VETESLGNDTALYLSHHHTTLRPLPACFEGSQAVCCGAISARPPRLCFRPQRRRSPVDHRAENKKKPYCCLHLLGRPAAVSATNLHPSPDHTSLALSLSRNKVRARATQVLPHQGCLDEVLRLASGRQIYIRQHTQNFACRARPSLPTSGPSHHRADVTPTKIPYSGLSMCVSSPPPRTLRAPRSAVRWRARSPAVSRAHPHPWAPPAA